MMRPYIFCEPFAGSAALTYFLLGAKPPISYLGSKSGFAATIAACLGLSPRQRPAGIVLGEIGPMAAVHAVLGGAVGGAAEVAGMVWCSMNSYRRGDPDSGCDTGDNRADPGDNRQSGAAPAVSASVAALPHPRAAEVAAIIRGWAGEEPRPLWERLRREDWPSLMPVPGGRWLGPQGVEEVARLPGGSVAVLWAGERRGLPGDSGGAVAGSGARCRHDSQAVRRPPYLPAPRRLARQRRRPRPAR